jgi:quercetin dioxygenase-like cupin family protein
MQSYNWNGVAAVELSPGLARQMIHTERMTILRVSFRKGVATPPHQHVHEQVTMLASGAMRFDLAGETIVLRPGDLLPIPSNVPHGAEALEDSVLIDVFTPPREDLMVKI